MELISEMKIRCKTQVLIEYSNIAVKAVSNKTTLPILECLLLTADDDGFRIVANDLELGIETNQIEAEIIENGCVALNAKVYMDIIRKLPGDDVLIESDSQDITVIRSNKTEFKIFGYPGLEFPLLPMVEKNSEYPVNALMFKNMIRQTIFSVSTDEYKAALMGEQFKIEGETLRLVAIDGFRLALKETRIDSADRNEEVIIPAKSLNELNKILPSDKDSVIYVYITDKHILFELKECRIVSRLIEGEFIKYDNFFKRDFNTLVTVKRDYLIDSLERAMLIAKGNVKINSVKLRISNDLIEVTSKTETGVFYDEIGVEIDGIDIEIGFNPRYLVDALKALETELVIMQFTSPLTPCIIKGQDDEDSVYLVTPLRLMG
jgi:DNA polymerase-3 subunit beta